MHPAIRAKVREIVRRIAIVSTEPTDAGEQMLTPFHKYGSVKCIRKKPVEAVSDIGDQFLFMVAAEKEGLIKVCVCTLSGVHKYTVPAQCTCQHVRFYCFVRVTTLSNRTSYICAFWIAELQGFSRRCLQSQQGFVNVECTHLSSPILLIAFHRLAVPLSVLMSCS